MNDCIFSETHLNQLYDNLMNAIDSIDCVSKVDNCDSKDLRLKYYEFKNNVITHFDYYNLNNKKKLDCKNQIDYHFDLIFHKLRGKIIKYNEKDILGKINDNYIIENILNFIDVKSQHPPKNNLDTLRKAVIKNESVNFTYNEILSFLGKFIMDCDDSKSFDEFLQKKKKKKLNKKYKNVLIKNLI